MVDVSKLYKNGRHLANLYSSILLQNNIMELQTIQKLIIGCKEILQQSSIFKNEGEFQSITNDQQINHTKIKQSKQNQQNQFRNKKYQTDSTDNNMKEQAYINLQDEDNSDFPEINHTQIKRPNLKKRKKEKIYEKKLFSNKSNAQSNIFSILNKIDKIQAVKNKQINKDDIQVVFGNQITENHNKCQKQVPVLLPDSNKHFVLQQKRFKRQINKNTEHQNQDDLIVIKRTKQISNEQTQINQFAQSVQRSQNSVNQISKYNQKTKKKNKRRLNQIKRNMINQQMQPVLANKNQSSYIIFQKNDLEKYSPYFTNRKNIHSQMNDSYIDLVNSQPNKKFDYRANSPQKHRYNNVSINNEEFCCNNLTKNYLESNHIIQSPIKSDCTNNILNKQSYNSQFIYLQNAQNSNSINSNSDNSNSKNRMKYNQTNQQIYINKEQFKIKQHSNIIINELILERRLSKRKQLDLGVATLSELMDQAYSKTIISYQRYFQFISKHQQGQNEQFIQLFMEEKIYQWDFIVHKITIIDHRRIATLLQTLFPQQYIIEAPLSFNAKIGIFLQNIYSLTNQQYFSIIKALDQQHRRTWWKCIEIKYCKAIRQMQRTELNICQSPLSYQKYEKINKAQNLIKRKQSSKQQKYTNIQFSKRTIDDVYNNKIESRSSSSSQNYHKIAKIFHSCRKDVDISQQSQHSNNNIANKQIKKRKKGNKARNQTNQNNRTRWNV